MLAKMGKAGLWCCVLALAGCTPGGLGQTFLSPPQGGTLSESARVARQDPAATLGLPRELEKVPLPPYLVEPGDVLLVQPADLDSPVRLPSDQPVLLDGSINLGRYGQLIVAGKTVLEIEGMVRAAVLAQNKDAGAITVRLVARQSKVFYVLGEVNAPGAFPLSGRETVLDGILAAGGLNDRASHWNIILTRPTRPDHCRVVLPIHFDDIVQAGDTTTNYQLAPGDRIYVPGRSWRECLCGHGKHDKHGVHQPGCDLSHDHHHDGPIPAPAGRLDVEPVQWSSPP